MCLAWLSYFTKQHLRTCKLVASGNRLANLIAMCLAWLSYFTKQHLRTCKLVASGPPGTLDEVPCHSNPVTSGVSPRFNTANNEDDVKSPACQLKRPPNVSPRFNTANNEDDVKSPACQLKRQIGGQFLHSRI
ncbi:hypothetical protein QE152_g25769 [Popillia japonica]|uniref:Uncharacterized protein n=1 Tax=Popillia japonica TaxID=7064 RepID=A0AAW1JZF3_POPJA